MIGWTGEIQRMTLVIYKHSFFKTGHVILSHKGGFYLGQSPVEGTVLIKNVVYF